MFMQSRGDSSILRSLAVAFGDGLAFGVGVKLSQNAARQIGATQRATVKRIEPTPPAPGPPEHKSGLDQKALEAIVAALEARLKEQAGHVDRQLADLEARLTLELKGLDEQDHSIAAQVTGNLAALEEQMVAVNREFGGEVARIVAEQVALQVEARVADHAAAAQKSLDEKISGAIDAAVEQRVAQALSIALEPMERRLAEIDTRAEQRIAATVRERLEPIQRQLREEIAHKEQEIADLQQRLADADNNLLEIVSGIGQVCRQAAERMARPSPPARPALTNDLEAAHPIENVAPEPEAPTDPSVEDPLPGFAQPQKPNRLWRVPLVSSLVMLASGGLLLIRYL